ncbi:hypothetical protein HC928_05115 [bacterium]|nr:hypothetical protein [bacterium]
MDLFGEVSPLLLVCGCALLCVVGIALLFVLQLLDVVLSVIGGVFGPFRRVSSGGGFEGFCGCIVLLVLFGGCCGLTVLTVNLVQTCGTPDAVNLCRVIGLG